MSSKKLSGVEIYNRNEHGLLSNAEYMFSEDGSIDWRSMVKEEHLFPNKLWFERFNKPIPNTIKGLKDHQLLIKLSGIKELAKLRGFTNVSYEFVKCELDHVSVVCSMTFIGNYETMGESVSFQDGANATMHNTSSFAKKFLETIACNRAFVRCVRNFLNVHIVGMDEMDSSDTNKDQDTSSKSSFSVHSTLERTAKESAGCKDFDCFKDILLELKESNKYINSQAEEWNSYSEIPSKEARVLLKILKDN
jgi:hypothetical protein